MEYYFNIQSLNDALALEIMEYPDMWTVETIPFIINPIVIDWINDYWDFVCWNEHGNECALTEIDFYEMLCDIIAYESDRYNTRDYLTDYNPDSIARMDQIRLMLTEIKF